MLNNIHTFFIIIFDILMIIYIYLIFMLRFTPIKRFHETFLNTFVRKKILTELYVPLCEMFKKGAHAHSFACATHCESTLTSFPQPNDIFFLCLTDSVLYCALMRDTDYETLIKLNDIQSFEYAERKGDIHATIHFLKDEFSHKMSFTITPLSVFFDDELNQKLNHKPFLQYLKEHFPKDDSLI